MPNTLSYYPQLSSTGLVTSVTASSPLVSSGGTNPNLSFSNQSANTFLAGPSSGSAAAPTFRDILLADLSAIYNGTLSNVMIGTGTLAAATTTSDDVAIGLNALNSLTTSGVSSGVIAIGQNAL